jgi:hypothetical protein
MNPFRRLSLALLLILLLIGFSEHLMAPASGTPHVLPESTCAVHQGVNLPANPQSSWNEPGVSPKPVRDETCVLDLVVKIPHPPTL